MCGGEIPACAKAASSCKSKEIFLLVGGILLIGEINACFV